MPQPYPDLANDAYGAEASRKLDKGEPQILRAATGGWVCLLDSDDALLPDRIAVLVRDLERARPEAMVHGRCPDRLGRGRFHSVPEEADRCTQSARGAAGQPATDGGGRGRAACAGLPARSVRPNWDIPAAVRRAGDTWFLVRLGIEGRWIVTGDMGAVVRRLAEGEAVITKDGTQENLRAQILSTEQMLLGARTVHQRRILSRRLGGLNFTLAKVPCAWALAGWVTLIGTRGQRQP